MLKEYRKLIDKIDMTASAFISFAVFYFLHLILVSLGRQPASFDYYSGMVFVFILVMTMTMLSRGISTYERFVSNFHILWELLICHAYGMFGVLLLMYIRKAPPISRIYMFGGVAISYLVIGALYLVQSLFYKRMRMSGYNYQNVLLIGDRHTIFRFIDTIEGNKALGLRIIGILSLDEMGPRTFPGYRYFGSIEKIRSVFDTETVDIVIMSAYKQKPAMVEKAMLYCQERGVEIWMNPDFMQNALPPHLDHLEHIPLFVFSMTPRNKFALLVKRQFDIIASLLLIVTFFIPMTIMAFFIRVTTKGPALFIQKRMGLNGRTFMLYKFRTMYSDAQQRKAEYNLKNEMKGPVFKMKKDPRITPFGAILRRFSLDELPQFFNVLNGNMSLVGPRPPLPTEVELYKGWQRRRLSMRPGITCIWQVSGRNRIKDFNKWVNMDLQYIDNWNIWLDFKILVKTIPAVINGTGC